MINCKKHYRIWNTNFLNVLTLIEAQQSYDCPRCMFISIHRDGCLGYKVLNLRQPTFADIAAPHLDIIIASLPVV